MTTATKAPPPKPVAHSGTVFDIGYRSYTGTREGRNRSRRAVYKDGLRAALGFGRGIRAKTLPWFFLFVLSAIATIMALIAGAAERLGGPGSAERMNLPSHGDYYSFASIILFVFAAIVAPELLCRDRREGTINLYLVRPLTSVDYVIARWAAFLTLMIAAAWLPQIILFLGLSGGDPTPSTYLREHWLDVPRFLASGLAIAAYTTGLAMLTASFTTRRAYASVFLIGLFVITTPFTIGLAQQIKGTPGQWISMFNLTNIPMHVNDIIFGEASEVTNQAPARQLGSTILVSWYLLWTIVPTGALWWRYRRLAP
jgi:ABC-2 type transport system permease protein